MSYLITIPYVNRSDLLDRALSSIPANIWDNGKILVLDNSATPKRTPIRHIPTVPLTFSQSMNFFRRIAIEQSVNPLLFMHNDAVAGRHTFEKLISMADTSDGKWGVIFTNYDALAAFNVDAMREIGEWDTNLPQYFADNDYYRRLRLAGWESRDSGLPVEHLASQTINSDPERAFLNSVTFPMYQHYYVKKWGGGPGQETFEKPFNRNGDHG